MPIARAPTQSLICRLYWIYRAPWNWVDCSLVCLLELLFEQGNIDVDPMRCSPTGESFLTLFPSLVAPFLPQFHFQGSSRHCYKSTAVSLWITHSRHCLKFEPFNRSNFERSKSQPQRWNPRLQAMACIIRPISIQLGDKFAPEPNGGASLSIFMPSPGSTQKLITTRQSIRSLMEVRAD